MMSVLVCNPRSTIESREIRADGSGRVEVVENKPLVRQGNLHTSQTKLLLYKVGIQDFNAISKLMVYTQALTKYATDSVSLIPSISSASLSLP